jgi:DNA-binding CsgD family transcriptional regulator
MISAELIRNAFGQQLEAYISPFELNVKPSYEVGRDFFRTFCKHKIAGYRSDEITSIADLLNIIHAKDIAFVSNFIMRSIEHINSSNALQLLKTSSQIIFRVKGKGGKLYYMQRFSVVNGISNGKLTSNFAYLKDVSWMRPHPGSWKLFGKDAALFDFNIPEVCEFKEVLTSREVEVLRLLARGFPARDIAEALFISVHTVKTHRKNMLKKIDASNTPQLIDLAKDMNLI